MSWTLFLWVFDVYDVLFADSLEIQATMSSSTNKLFRGWHIDTAFMHAYLE